MSWHKSGLVLAFALCGIINAYTEWLKAWFKIQALEDSVRLHEKDFKSSERVSDIEVRPGMTATVAFKC
jgi:hypothetical protein